MPAARRAMPVPLDEQALGLLQDIANRLGDLEVSHAVMADAVGKPGPEGRGGTGLVGQVAQLRVDVQGLLGLKSLGRGVLIGVLVAGAVALLGAGEALKALGGTALLGLH